MSGVVIFAPSPLLTVTIEATPEEPEVHLHAGGQGVWQARMLQRLGFDITMCCVLSGETGRALRHLLDEEGITVVAVDREARGGAFVHDRRNGERDKLVETAGDPIGRHDLDELYGLTLREGLEADTVILSGPASEHVVPDDIYRRLAADLRTAGRRVVVDLAGDRLTAALEGGVTVAKVSDDELLDDGRITEKTVDQIAEAMHRMAADGAETVVVTRAHEPFLLLTGRILSEVTPPEMEVTDTAGAGDSLTAGLTAGIIRGETIERAITLGAAAGALNVTRHGLGTGDPGAIEKLRELVTVCTLGDEPEGASQVSPDELAALAGEPDSESSDSDTPDSETEDDK